MKALLCTLALLLVAAPLWGQAAFAPYAARTEFLAAPPGGAGIGLQAHANPALLTYAEGLESAFAWSTATATGRPTGQWGLFTALPHLGFGLLRHEQGRRRVDDYRLAFSGGDRRLSMGLAYGWARGDTRFFGRENHFSLGALYRPSRQLSAGLTFTSTFDADEREAAIDLGVRPWGSERLTFFADWARTSFGRDRTYWSAGAAVEPLEGLLLVGRYFENRTLSIGLNLGLGRASLQVQPRFDEEGDHAFSTYAARLGPPEPSLLDRLHRPPPAYLELELQAPLRHRRYAFFDQAHTLIELTDLLVRARRDPAIGGIALNLSGLQADPELAWELRQQLLRLRQSGKRVVVYMDRADLRLYHLASAADHLVLDPAGLVVLEGFVAGQTYFKKALEKLGIGFEEWRFFEYKSAMEALSRENMSAADREQLQALVDDFYALAREEICQSRRLAPEAFDRLVDEEVLFLPGEALDRGLVDRLGRWDRMGEILEELEGRPASLLSPEDYPRPRQRAWGQKERIAVVYALGICALDQGIEARKLVEEIARLRDDEGIAALILRVDSPGGDALASDLVADALIQCRKHKPVIVSQGYVAASGGYWISMYADAIVAAPNTITGSIGVIGGWLYDRGLKESLGFSTDRVQAGAHADLDFGMRLPLLGVSLPDRNLSDAERQTMERAIRAFYRDFVDKVAEGRQRRPEEIEAVAQGRVWSGRRALEKGLVDRLGGLETAVEVAKEKAGIPADASVELVEVPHLSPLSPDFFQPRLLGARQEPLLEYLEYRLQHNGQPLLLLPTPYLPETYLQRR